MKQIEVIVERGGLVTIHVPSLVYDLWEDYEAYRREAQSIDRASDPLRYKRLVRAAMHTFFAYFEGVLNSWIAQLEPKLDLEDVTFFQKIGIVRRAAGTSQPWLDIENARRIRNTVVHPIPASSDLELVESLLDGQFFRDADEVVNWINSASRTLNLDAHPDVPRILKELADKLGTVVEGSMDLV